MKKLTYLLVCILVCKFSMAQQSPASLQWNKTIRGQYSSPFEDVVKSTKDNIGNIYVLCQDYINIYVVKYNASGAIMNVMVYNGTENGTEYAYDIKLDNNGGIIIGASVPYLGQNCPAVIKFDANGNLLWDRVITGSFDPDNKVRSVSVDVNNDVHFCGALNDSVFAGKLNNSGSVLWRKTYAPNSSYSTGEANMLVSDDNGITYLAGKVNNTNNNSDFFISKLSGSGIVQWNKMINGFANANDEALFIKIDNNYNCYVGGMIADTSAANKTATVVKYNAAGGQQWIRKLYQTGLSGQEEMNMEDFHLDNQGNSYVALKENRLTFNSLNAKLVKLSSLGAISWTKLYEGNGLNQIPRSISTDNFGNVYACGTEDLPVGADVFMLKYDPSGNSLFSIIYEYSPLAYEVPKTLTIDNSGNVYLATTFDFSTQSKKDIGLLKFNNVGSLQFESLYDAPISSISQSKKLILDNGKTYALGTILNNGSAHDMAISNFDAQGFVQWQNVVDEGAGSNYAADMAKHGSELYMIGTENVASGTVIIKYDSIGSLVWLDTVHQSVYSRIVVQSNGRPVVAGGAISGINEKDFRIAIYDPATGNMLFQNAPAQFADYRTEVYSLATDQNDNIYALGLCKYLAAPYNVKIKLQKFNSNGILQWSKEISGTDSSDFTYANAHKVVIDNNSNVYVMASATILATGSVQPILLKYDQNGNQIWRQNYAVSSSNELLSSAVMTNDDFIYTLSRQQNASPIVLRKINPITGNEDWVQIPGMYPYTPIYDGMLALDSAKHIFVASSAFLANYNNNDQLILLSKFDSLGNSLWNTHFDGTYRGTDAPNDLNVSNNGRIYVLASAVMSNYGNIPDITLLKFCDTPDPVISSGGPTSNLCAGSSVVLQAGGGISYLWNDETTTASSNTIDTTGLYYATVYLSDGCFKNTDTIQVNLKAIPSAPQICAVTVDSLSTHNIIGWDKSGLTGYSAFNIYREDVTNVYTLIATVDGDSLSEYHDFGANPNTTTKRYKISAVDSCGQESTLSNYHNTIYIVNSGLGQYTWNPLYTIENTGNPVDNYVLMRDDNNTGVWNQVTITSGTQNTLVDPAYASFPNASYRVETIWNINCNPTRGAINTSRSNIKSPNSVGLLEQQSSSAIAVWPNPFNEQVQFKSEAYLTNAEISVFNNLGQLVESQYFSGTETIINTEKLSAGLYYYKVISGTFAEQGIITKSK